MGPKTQVSPETPVWLHCLPSQQCAVYSGPRAPARQMVVQLLPCLCQGGSGVQGISQTYAHGEQQSFHPHNNIRLDGCFGGVMDPCARMLLVLSHLALSGEWATVFLPTDMQAKCSELMGDGAQNCTETRPMMHLHIHDGRGSICWSISPYGLVHHSGHSSHVQLVIWCSLGGAWAMHGNILPMSC